MRAKKIVVLVSLPTLLISLAVSLILNSMNCNSLDYWINVSLAIFGSSIIAFTIYLIEYFTERRIVLEEYWDICRSIINQIGEVKCFYTVEPYDLICECLIEYQNNNRPPSFEDEQIKKNQIAKNALINYLDEKNKAVDKYPFDAGYYEQKYEDIIAEYMLLLKFVVMELVKISKIDLSPLHNVYGKLNFIFGNKKFRPWIYDNLYHNIHTTIFKVWENSNILENYLNEECGNLRVLLKHRIDPIQKEWFNFKNTTKGDCQYTSVYNIFRDKVSNSNEKLRCKIYHQKYEVHSSQPIEQTILKIK